MEYNNLKDAVRGVIRENHQNEITGQILQDTLINTIDSLGDGYQFKGIAVPGQTFGSPDQKVFYIASRAGEYAGHTLRLGELAVLSFNTQWSFVVIYSPQGTGENGIFFATPEETLYSEVSSAIEEGKLVVVKDDSGYYLISGATERYTFSKASLGDNEEVIISTWTLSEDDEWTADAGHSIEPPFEKGDGVNSVQQKGTGARALGNASCAEGSHTRANNKNEHAEGSYNLSHTGEDMSTRHSIGIGTSENNRKNAVEVMDNGDVFIKNLGGYDGTNPYNATPIHNIVSHFESDIALKQDAESNDLHTADKTVVGAINENKQRIDNLFAIGRYLAVWNAATGLPTSNPSGYPYDYRAGDYFLVGIVAAEGGTNYMPEGSAYNGEPSETPYTDGELKVGDRFFYDGNEWKPLIASYVSQVVDVTLDGVSTLNNGIAELHKETAYVSTNNTFAEVLVLYNTGKHIIFRASSYEMPLMRLFEDSEGINTFLFGSLYYNNITVAIDVSRESGWGSVSNLTLETTSNKEAETLTPTSTIKYPSSKAVADYVDERITAKLTELGLV